MRSHRSLITVGAIMLSACEKQSPPAVSVKYEMPVISITPAPVPSPSPPVRHAVPRPQPTLAPDKVLEQIIEEPSIQQKRWAEAKIKPSSQIAIDKAVMLYLRTKDRYETVEKMRTNGVPAPVLFGLHMRESSNSFACHLHEGSSLLHRTRYVPKNRPPPPADPPFTWESSAEDAVYVADRLQGPWDTVKWSLDRIEGYNGLGYRNRGVPSPYLFAGTTVYEKGKYTGDGKYSASAIDQQLGVIAVLKRMNERGIPLPWQSSP